MTPEDIALVLDQVRQFVRRTVVPLEAQIEDDDAVPGSVIAQAKAMGLYGFAIPEQYGGLGMTMADEVRLAMELGWTTPSLRSLFGTNNGIAGHVLLDGGTEQQKQAWLPRLASGEVVASFALTEEAAGSDPAGLRTRAVRDGDGWTITGSKRYITNSLLADVLMVFARTDPESSGGNGISVFLVPTTADGVTVGTKDEKMGQRGSLTADVGLDDVHVPAEALIGEQDGEGTGFRTAMRCLAHGRLHISALCVGMARRLVRESVDYAATRVQGGGPIGGHQLIQALLAESQTEMMAGEAMVLKAADDYDAAGGSAGSSGAMRISTSATKYFCSEMVGRVADRAVQIHGGAGYMRGVPVERMYRDVRLFRIYEGTSQIQQLIIGRELVREATARLA